MSDIVSHGSSNYKLRAVGNRSSAVNKRASSCPLPWDGVSATDGKFRLSSPISDRCIVDQTSGDKLSCDDVHFSPKYAHEHALENGHDRIVFSPCFL